MSTNIVPLSSDDTPSFNNSIHSEAKSSMRSLEVPFKATGSISQPRPLDNHHKATTSNNVDYHVGAPALSNMICQNLVFMKEAMAEVQKYADHMNVQINQACEKFEELKTRGGSERELGELKNAVMKLKSQICLKHKIHSADSKPCRNPWFDGSINNSSNQIDVNKVGDDNILHSLHKDPKFKHTTAFEHFKVSFLGLPFTLKVCLFCFLRFPEMVTIKKKLMIYWWIGEGLLPPIPMDQKTKAEIGLGKTTEDFGNEFMDELIAKDFIEPIYNNCDLVVDSCRMRPFVRSALTIVAERFGFSSVYTLGPDTPTLAQYQEFRCLLNVGAAIIDGGPELFLKMNHFRILYLGRWQSSATHHIEVSDTKILNGLRTMSQLRFLSLRGISLITELPRFISQLTNLKILDLRACHNLEVVPDEIDMLKSLTHLDMSDCYFLDRMPKGLGSLSQLEVLKGFVIGHSTDKSSTIADLAKLSKLRKLSIYTSMKEFSTKKQLRDLPRLETLQNLKISWSRCISQGETDTAKRARARVINPYFSRLPSQYLTSSPSPHNPDERLKLPSSLQKLELECFPEKITPDWPANMNLKKLYIRGGLFCDLCPVVATNIKILRLKYLSKLEMDWREFRELFPNLISLEKVKCPRLTFFPCDANGAWMNRANTQGWP